jgi:hypothetical protein
LHDLQAHASGKSRADYLHSSFEAADAMMELVVSAANFLRERGMSVLMYVLIVCTTGLLLWRTHPDIAFENRSIVADQLCRSANKRPSMQSVRAATAGHMHLSRALFSKSRKGVLLRCLCSKLETHSSSHAVGLEKRG